MSAMRVLPALLAAAWCFATCPISLGAERPAASDPGPGLDLAGTVPDWADLGAPDWVKPGTQLAYSNAAASIVQSRYIWVEDPMGGFVDKKTGKHYRKSDAEHHETMASGSGEGISEFDVIAVDGARVAIAVTTYGLSHTTEPPTLLPLPGAGWVMPGAAVNGAWVHPDLLLKVEGTGLPGMLVVRGPYPLNGKVYDSLSVASQSETASTSVTYDMYTGVLLATHTSTQGAAQPITARGEDPPKGNTYLTASYLLGVRQRHLPGWDGANPDWARAATSMHYQGTHRFVNPVDPSSADIRSPVEYTVALSGQTEHWALCTTTMVLTQFGVPQRSESQSITGPSGMYWVDPHALEALTEGQVVDEDPSTRIRTTVARIQPSPSGGQVVTLLSEGPGLKMAAAYEKSTGALIGFGVVCPASGITIEVERDR